MNFPFSVYGGVISGFQRYDANNMVAIGSSVCVALVNVVVLTAGYGLDHAGHLHDHRPGARVFRLPSQRIPHLPGLAHQLGARSAAIG